MTQIHLFSKTIKSLILFAILLPSAIFANWQKMNPVADVDKSAHGHVGELTCWMATAANMLAAAGHGQGNNVQERADGIYDDLVGEFGLKSGFIDTALTWWLSEPNNDPNINSPYRVVTVYGSKEHTPWSDPDGAKFIGNTLRRCYPVGLSISWPETGGGHAITCWGDSGDANMLNVDPNNVLVSDSDRDNASNYAIYTYDNYTNPNPGGENLGPGWYFNYSQDHPYIKHIVTLTTVDYGAPIQFVSSRVLGSYRIHQNNQTQSATDLHYKVGSESDLNIYTYLTTIDWPTTLAPVIQENNSPPTELTVNWNLQSNPVPYCHYVTINTELVLPLVGNNAIDYNDVYFTYPAQGVQLPSFKWNMYSTMLSEANDPNITGGYIIGAFDLLEDKGSEGMTVVGEYRFVSEYKYNQDREHHSFALNTQQGYTNYYAGNFRFGHSYGMPSANSLWQFYNWMSYSSEIRRLDYGYPIYISINWDDRLPYPQGENYTGQYSTPECTEFLPEDLNRDCDVNFYDFAFFADNWLMSTKL